MWRGPDRAAWTALVMLATWLAITAAWWILAFARLPGPTPEWLAVTRSVCFGSGPGGLPDTYGWMMLLAAPATMLSVLLALWWADLGRGLRWVLASGRGRAVVALILAPLLLGLGQVVRRVQQVRRAEALWTTQADPGALPAAYPRTDRPAPAMSLIDQRGERFELSHLRGHPVVLTFAYAHCATVCPLLIQNVLEGARGAPEAEPRVVLLTLDPWRDTPSALPRLAKAWNLQTDEYVLSGPIDRVEATLDAYDVPRDRDRRSGTVNHPALVYIIGPEGRIAYTFNDPAPGWVAEGLRRALRDSRS